MISVIEARVIARTFLDNLISDNIQLEIFKEYDFGEGIFYVFQSKEFIETNDFIHFLIGNKPFIVDKVDKSIFFIKNESLSKEELISRFKLEKKNSS